MTPIRPTRQPGGVKNAWHARRLPSLRKRRCGGVTGGIRGLDTAREACCRKVIGFAANHSAGIG